MNCSLKKAQKVIRDQNLILDSSIPYLAAARAPPLLLHLGILLVVDKEVGLGKVASGPREGRLAVLFALGGRVELLDSTSVLQREGVGAPVLGVLLDVAFLGCKMKVILGNVYPDSHPFEARGFFGKTAEI